MPRNDRDEDEPKQPPDVPLPRVDPRKVKLKHGEVHPSDRPANHHRDYRDEREHEDESYGFDDRPERPSRYRAPPLTQRSHRDLSMLQTLFEFFIPPLNDSPEANRRYRIAISLGVLTLSGFTAAAFGYMPIIGFSGFAYASAVKDIKVELLEQRIFDNRVRQCEATTPESRQFYGQKVAELLAKYQETAKAQYPLPSCVEIK